MSRRAGVDGPLPTWYHDLPAAKLEVESDSAAGPRESPGSFGSQKHALGAPGTNTRVVSARSLLENGRARAKSQCGRLMGASALLGRTSMK